jgi:hypothetical protein
LLPEFHAPLVEAEDVPDHALDKNFVLIHGNETPQGLGSDFFDKDGVGRSVSLKYSKRNESHHFLFADP